MIVVIYAMIRALNMNTMMGLCISVQSRRAQNSECDIKNYLHNQKRKKRDALSLSLSFQMLSFQMLLSKNMDLIFLYWTIFLS
jgi:hypothetical protein